MNNPKLLLGPMRVPFLVLTPACVLLGLGTAIYTTGQINWLYFVLALVGSLAAHISVNAFNEYYDFQSGLDAKTIKTPFSGGSGTLPENPEMARPALILAWVTFAITALIGVFFLFVRGWALLPLGLLGLITIFTYTMWIARLPILCLIAPGLGFGTVMVMGTHFALTGEYSWVAFAASLVPFFLVSNLLLLNQFPDVEADQSVGRKHFPITVGKQQSVRIYLVFLLLTYLSLGLGVALKYLPLASLIGLLTLVLAVPISKGVLQYAEDTEKLIPYMGLNVVVNILTPVLVAIGLFIG